MLSKRYTEACLLWITCCFLEQSPEMLRSERCMSELGADSFDMVELQALVEEAFDIHIDTPLATHITFDDLLKQVLRIDSVL